MQNKKKKETEIAEQVARNERETFETNIKIYEYLIGGFGFSAITHEQDNISFSKINETKSHHTEKYLKIINMNVNSQIFVQKIMNN